MSEGDEHKNNPLGTGFVPQSTTVDKNFAAFDKGGKLLRMMEKMGYKKGMGIGKDGSGIAVPVEVVVRQSGVGIGFDKSDKIKKPEKQQEPEKPQSRQGWKHTGAKMRKRVPPTAYDIIHEEMEHHKVPEKISSIRDMTGSEEKLLTDFSNLSSSQKVPDIKRLPELRHNISLITNLAKTDLSYLAKQLSFEEDSQMRRKDDCEKTKELIRNDNEELMLTRDYLSICKSITTLLSNHKDEISDLDLSPQDCYSIFKTSIEQLPSTHHLQSLKYNVFSQILHPRIQSWSPVDTPSYLVSIFSLSKEVLGDMHDWLVYTFLIPKIRGYILNFDPYNPEPLIHLLELYKPVMGQWTWSSLTLLIIPRLESLVEGYQFQRDWRIHVLLVPFLSIIRMDGLWKRVRERLTVYLSTWKGDDNLAMEIYDYWSQLWEDDDLEKFLERGVLPRLVEFMRKEVVVNPSNQDLGALERVLAWRGRLKDHLLSNLLVTEFFSKWDEVLRIWISTPQVDLDEISGWYTAWKTFFDNQNVLHLLGVKEAFKNGLDLINQGLSGNIRGVSKVKAKSKVPKLVKTLNTSQLSFKELVELECAERSIEFVPLQKRNAEGKEVYRMGKLKVYIDDGVLFVNVNGEFSYMGIEDAMAMAF